MSGVDWSLLYLAVAGLTFVFVLTLCIAGAREDRQRERLYLERIRRDAERQGRAR